MVKHMNKIAKITLKQVLDTFYFGDPNNQQVMVYTTEDYCSGILAERKFEEPDFTIGCSSTIPAESFIKEEWLNKECYIIDICHDGNIRVVLDMEED